MIVRMLFAAVGALLLGSGTPAMAQDASGMLVCEQDVRAIQTYLETNRTQLSAEAVESAEQQLDIARGQCSSSPQTGQNTVAALRRDLGMEESQTARQPGETAPPQGE